MALVLVVHVPVVQIVDVILVDNGLVAAVGTVGMGMLLGLLVLSDRHGKIPCSGCAHP